MGNIVRYSSGSADTDRNPSPGLWDRFRCPWEAIKSGAVEGVAFFDDFLDHVVSGQRWTLAEADANAVISQLVTETGGVLQMALATSDNEEANIMLGAGEEVLGIITENSLDKLWFEMRFKISSVADDVVAVALGLAEETMTGANLQTDDTGVLAVKDYVAFRSVHVNGGTAGTNAKLAAAYATASGAEVAAIAAAQTMVANTWYKVGGYFDGLKTLTWVVDGVPDVTETDITGANFPDGEELTLFLAAKLGATTGATVKWDWARFAQIYN